MKKLPLCTPNMETERHAFKKIKKNTYRNKESTPRNIQYLETSKHHHQRYNIHASNSQGPKKGENHLVATTKGACDSKSAAKLAKTAHASTASCWEQMSFSDVFSHVTPLKPEANIQNFLRINSWNMMLLCLVQVWPIFNGS